MPKGLSWTKNTLTRSSTLFAPHPAWSLILKHGKISKCSENPTNPAAGTSTAKRPRSRLVHPDDDIRYDGQCHYLIKMEECKVGVCKNCRERDNRNSRSRFLCEKCNVPTLFCMPINLSHQAMKSESFPL